MEGGEWEERRGGIEVEGGEGGREGSGRRGGERREEERRGGIEVEGVRN